MSETDEAIKLLNQAISLGDTLNDTLERLMLPEGIKLLGSRLNMRCYLSRLDGSYSSPYLPKGKGSKSHALQLIKVFQTQHHRITEELKLMNKEG